MTYDIGAIAGHETHVSRKGFTAGSEYYNIG